MAEIHFFNPQHASLAEKNLQEFIRMCRDDLTVFGSDLDWNDCDGPMQEFRLQNWASLAETRAM